MTNNPLNPTIVSQARVYDKSRSAPLRSIRTAGLVRVSSWVICDLKTGETHTSLPRPNEFGTAPDLHEIAFSLVHLTAPAYWRCRLATDISTGLKVDSLSHTYGVAKFQIPNSKYQGRSFRSFHSAGFERVGPIHCSHPAARSPVSTMGKKKYRCIYIFLQVRSRVSQARLNGVCPVPNGVLWGKLVFVTWSRRSCHKIHRLRAT
jgi:hypothetical protein